MHKLMQERRDAATKHNEAVAIRAAEQAVLNQQHGVGAVGSTAGGAAASGSAGELAGTELTSARSYIHRVQAVLEKTQKTHAYRTFLRIILEASRAVALQDCLDVITVWNEVKVILHGHPDLLEEFKDYLPPGSTPVIERHENKLAIELRRGAGRACSVGRPQSGRRMPAPRAAAPVGCRTPFGVPRAAAPAFGAFGAPAFGAPAFGARAAPAFGFAPQQL